MRAGKKAICFNLKTYFSIINDLSFASNSNSLSEIIRGESYTAIITANEGYELTDVYVTMGEEDITATAVNNGVITIEKVTGDIVITVETEKLPDREYFFKDGVYTFPYGTTWYKDIDGGMQQVAYWSGALTLEGTNGMFGAQEELRIANNSNGYFSNGSVYASGFNKVCIEAYVSGSATATLKYTYRANGTGSESTVDTATVNSKSAQTYTLDVGGYERYGQIYLTAPSGGTLTVKNIWIE